MKPRVLGGGVFAGAAAAVVDAAGWSTAGCSRWPDDMAALTGDCRVDLSALIGRRRDAVGAVSATGRRSA